jgi:hypothetical protein
MGLPSYNLPYRVRYITIAPDYYYTWVNAGEYDCPLCAAMEGITLPLEAWQSGIRPGFHPHCNCRLEPRAVGEYLSVPVIEYTPQPFTITDILNGKFFEQAALMCTPAARALRPALPGQEVWFYNVLSGRAEKTHYSVPMPHERVEGQDRNDNMYIHIR